MNAKEYKTKELWGRFTPYFRKYYGTLARDLFCAALTTVCELVLPMIMRYITNVGIRDLAALTIGTVGRLGGIYLVLRIVDCIAAYYMANMGHVMGARIVFYCGNQDSHCFYPAGKDQPASDSDHLFMRTVDGYSLHDVQF